ncbi:MAG: hypothetical protein ACOYEO_01725 [bacterium]|jgi:dihydroorotate dehydrogenase electron transfer subunit
MEGPARCLLQCVDASSEYCPCYLAESGDCIVCSLLTGADFCECSWSGSCIYLNYRFNQGTIYKRQEEVVFAEKNEIAPGLFDFQFQLGAQWLPALSQAGALLFVRPLTAPDLAAVPISVVDIKNSKIRLVVSSVGPKTRLLAQAKAELVIRGPYFSGLINNHKLTQLHNTKVVFVAGGVGQSPLILAAKTLLRGENHIWACLAPGVAGMVYVRKDLEALGVTVQEVTSLRLQGMLIVKHWLTEIKPVLLVVAGPEGLQTACRELIQDIRQKGHQIDLVTTQNAVMCCGEGLCGSCLGHEFKQKRVPLCKAQYLL